MTSSLGQIQHRMQQYRRKIRHVLLFRRSIYGYLFTLPALLFFAIFSLYPTISGLYLSLTEYTLLKPPRWIGLTNYTELPHDALFHQALSVTAIFVAGTVLPKAIFSLGLALIFVKAFAGRGFFKTLYFTPALLSGVVVALVWELLLDPAGLINALIAPLNGGQGFFWLSDPKLTPVALIAIDNWAGIPFFVTIWSAGLAGIPREYYDAARMDGAGRIQAFLNITLPLLKPTILFVLVISTIGAFQSFALQYVMTRGGPNNHTMTIALLIYKYGFNFFRMGSAAAISMVLFLVIAVLTLIQIRWIRSEETTYM